MAEVERRKLRALDKIDGTTIERGDVEARKERALQKIEHIERNLEINRSCVTSNEHLTSEETQVEQDEYTSFRNRIEKSEDSSEDIRRDLRLQVSEAIESEVSQTRGRAGEQSEHNLVAKTIDNELKRQLDEQGNREVRMYVPEVRCKEVSSVEHLQEIITQDFPEAKEYRDYEAQMSHCISHFKTRERFNDRRRVSGSEIIRFAEEINEPEGTVRSWVVDGARPRIYCTLENIMTRQEAEEKIDRVREKLQGIDSFVKMEERFSHPYHEAFTKTQVSYSKDLECARRYFDFLDEMEKGGSIGEVSARVGFAQSNASRYLGGRIPRLIKIALEPIPEQYHLREIDGRYRIDTPEKYERALRRHSFVKDLPDFPSLDHEARVYVGFKDLKAKGMLPDMTVKDIAAKNRVGEKQLGSWLNGDKTQELVHRLETYEQARGFHENKFARVAFDHRIDPSIVYENFRHLREVKNPTADDLARALEMTLRSSGLDTRVQWAELRELHSGGPHWLRDVANRIARNRGSVENILNQRVELDSTSDERIRVGVLESKVYLRRADITEHNWLNIYKNEMFYFRSLEEKNRLVDEAKARLGIPGSVRLSKITEQLTDKESRVTGYWPHYDVIRGAPHLRGETLALVLDTNGKRIQDIQGQIMRIGKINRGRGGISNPQFPENKLEIDSMLASVLGAGLSDGHISKDNWGFIYTESNNARVDLFHEDVNRFGGVYRSQSVRENGVNNVRFSSVYGRALERRGMPSGDRSLQNEGLPDWLKENPELAPVYLGPMWAQDGCFPICRNRRRTFQWERGVVLKDPSKESTYGVESLATEEHAKLLREYGEKKISDTFGITYEITKGRLDSLAESSDRQIAIVAEELKRIAKSNPPQLLVDEIALLESLGIKSNKYLVGLTYYEKTQRVSALWHANTATKQDAMRVALMCAPEDVVKRAKVEDWMKRDSALRDKVAREIEDERRKNV